MEVLKCQIILLVVHLLILADLFINTFSTIKRLPNESEMLLYVVQDVLLVLGIIILFLLFFNTYMFQAGLGAILISRFKATIIVAFLYLLLSIPLHVWILKLRWNRANAYIWKKDLLVLFGFQRFFSVFYYFFYRRTVLRFADPRLYKDSLWIREELNRRH